MRFREYSCIDNQECLFPWEGQPEDNVCEKCGIHFDDSLTVWFKVWMKVPYRIRQAFKLSTYSRPVRFFFQRRRRGFDESELWSLDYTFARLMRPRLRAFIDEFGGRSVPSFLGENIAIEERSEEWLEILRKIHRALELMESCESAYYTLSEQEHEEVSEGLKLFSEHIRDIWD